MNRLEKDNIVFLVGPSRSGTTLMSTRLGMHRDIAITPETHLFSSSYSGNFFRRSLSQKNSTSLFRYLYLRNVRLLDIPGNAQEWSRLFERNEVRTIREGITLILNRLHDCAGKRILLEKSPSHIEHLGKIFEYFPTARVIFMFRDPRDTVDSLDRVPWSYAGRLRNIAYWGWCVREYRKWKNRKPSQVILVKYEDFVQNPASILTKLSAFIEIDEARFWGDRVDASAVPNWEVNWKRGSLDPIVAGDIYKWKKNFTNSYGYETSFVIPEMDYLQYEFGMQDSSGQSSLKDIVWKTWIFDILFRINLFRRTHIKERAHRFRREQLNE